MDLRELIPRVRRAVEGPAGVPAGPGRLSDDQILALIADAVADTIFFTGGLFGHQLLVTGRDSEYNAPNEWDVEPELTDDAATVIVAVAALMHFFHVFRDYKVQETIANEGASWSYSMSANLVGEQMKMLREQRQAALDRLTAINPVPTMWVNLLEARDAEVSRAIEPFVADALGA